MRIALFHNVPSGGAKRAIYEWTRRLAKRHEIDVYTLSTADHDFCDVRLFVENYYIIEYAPRKLFKSPWGRLNQLQRYRDLNRLTDIGRNIAEKIGAEKYDVVFANTCLYTHTPAFLQFVQTPSIYYLHEPFGQQFIRPIWRPYLENNGWRGALDRVDPLIRSYKSRLAFIQYGSVKHTDLLLANSGFTQNQMKSALKVDAPVCHYGVDHETFRLLPSVHKENCVISVGELTPRKGFDFIITSIGQIPVERRPTLKLACNIINPAERSYVENLASVLGVDLVIFEKLETNALAVEYNRARLCVYAPVMEPFGLVPLEAMACGTPVVGVAEGGVLETVIDGENGRLVERDPAQFAEAIQELLDNPGLRWQLGHQGRKNVLENWTWERSVAEVEQHLCETANQKQLSKPGKK